MSVLTERCVGCWYVETSNGTRALSALSCGYLDVEGHRRGCPAGDECDKYKPGPRPLALSRKRLHLWETPEQRTQFNK